jgi:peptidyl-prolyl cis-trans isomerase B (cyclophilin B)
MHLSFYKQYEIKGDIMSYETLLNERNPKVTMIIKDYGTIELELFPTIAPNSVNNFINLIQKKYYDGLVFHRIIPGFMIQGGGGKEQTCSIKGEFATNGFENTLIHSRGVISMARTSDPNSATSQFFIMHQNAPHLDRNYAAFGGLTSGIELVDKIASQSRDFRDRPDIDIVIESVTVDTKGITYDAPVCYKKVL